MRQYAISLSQQSTIGTVKSEHSMRIGRSTAISSWMKWNEMMFRRNYLSKWFRSIRFTDDIVTQISLCIASNRSTARINSSENNNLSRKDFGKLVFPCTALCLRTMAQLLTNINTLIPYFRCAKRIHHSAWVRRIANKGRNNGMKRKYLQKPHERFCKTERTEHQEKENAIICNQRRLKMRILSILFAVAISKKKFCNSTPTCKWIQSEWNCENGKRIKNISNRF